MIHGMFIAISLTGNAVLALLLRPAAVLAIAGIAAEACSGSGGSTKPSLISTRALGARAGLMGCGQSGWTEASHQLMVSETPRR